MPTSTLSIAEIKEQILQQARARQTRIERGAYDVPLRYAPLPLAELLDYLGQWEYRRDSLALAVPPASPGLGARLSRLCKSLVSKSLRWLLIRQVEFNTAALRHGRVLAEVLAVVDKNQAELLAAMTNLKMEVHTLAQRAAQLEGSLPNPNGAAPQLAPEDTADNGAAHQSYLNYLVGEGGGSASRRRERVLVLGSGRGDFLRFLVAEGIAAEGIDTDAELVDYCRERELPAAQASCADYLQGLANDGLSGIVLESRAAAVPARELGELIGLCWTRLKKGGVLIVEVENPLHFGAIHVPIELLHFLFESRCFVVVDSAFSAPASSEVACIVQSSQGGAFDLKDYRRYAVIGRK
jgi:SAM-dependent methyltransferase